MKQKVNIPACNDCVSDMSGLFRHLNNEQLTRLNFEKSCQFYHRGDHVFHENNKATGCYCVNSGILKLYKTGIEGKEQIILFAKRGDIIGYRSVIGAEPFCTTARVHEDATLCFIPSEVLLQLIQESHAFSLAMLKLACKELGEANSFITDIAQKTVKERLAEIILYLRTSFGTDNEGFIKIVLTREEMANIVGTATESVIRQLSEFKSDGLIELKGRKIKVLQIKPLERYSNLA
ncbi:MAG: Crp/Fnr family transcriptional regulator [Salinivirgaceae bacterium]|nr:Crp/Fnr family transcriptional regulator [Salinivirgaceae bacterium]MDD4747959.1 Crp/Fnr family transcriptional regulator [Salinivirgaceae bacterium]MDY0279633.1 Crp/Fnr family transcriptional regulator [Salinivirgaceae bacterium]